MNNAVVYIAASFLQRLVGFFVHWYIGGTRVFLAIALRLRAVVKKLFGRAGIERPVVFVFLGPLAVLKALMYVLGANVLIVLYLAWLIIPLTAIFKVVSGFLA